MLIAVGGIITAAIILANAFALADILDNADLPAPVSRAWAATVVLAPGVGAAVWFARRRPFPPGGSARRDAVGRPPLLTGPGGTPMHEEIHTVLPEQA